MLTGLWTYRSYRNQTKLIGDDAEAALAAIFGEGMFELAADNDTRFHGALGMGTGYALQLTGKLMRGRDDAPDRFTIVGEGIDGTATQGWRYDYRGVVAFAWPEAIDQIPALVGTVIRVRAHGANAPAGYTASFIAVSHQAEAAARSRRSFALTKGL